MNKGLLHVSSRQVSSSNGIFASTGIANSATAAYSSIFWEHSCGRQCWTRIPKWPKVLEMSKYTTSTAKMVTVLREVIAHYGLPEQGVSKHGPQFTLLEFSQYLAVNGVKHICRSPYHPSSNGTAEWLVQIVKQLLKALCHKGVSFEWVLASLLLQYRTTPHAKHAGVSSSSLLFGQSLRN